VKEWMAWKGIYPWIKKTEFKENVILFSAMLALNDV